MMSVQWLDYGQDAQGSVPGKKDFSLHNNVQTGSGAHLASYSMGTAAGAWS